MTARKRIRHTPADARRLILVETTAAAQLLAELFALAFMALAGALSLLRWRRRAARAG